MQIFHLKIPQLSVFRIVRWTFIILVLLSIFSITSWAQVVVDFPEKKDSERAKANSYAHIDLSGLWEAEVSQLNWIGQPEFEGVKGKMLIDIKQKGNAVKGTLFCRAKFANNQGYLWYDKHFEGTWEKGVLTYQDVRVEDYVNTNKSLRHVETCLKTATLSFYETQNTDHLEGNWKGLGHLSDVACIPGKIHLTKVKEEELVVEQAQTLNTNFAQLDKQPVEIKWNRKNKIKKVRNRKVKKGKTITVDSTRLSITVYDHKKDDGDIVSLNYNGNWILEKFEIDHSKHQVDVFMEAGKTTPGYLLLYAHNLGDYPPNTVAIIVDDGKRKQRFILNADMNQSDVIYFKQRQK